MKLCSLAFLLLIVVIPHLPAFAQTSAVTPSEITPSEGSIVNVKLSPDGTHVAIMSVDLQGEPNIEVWNTSETASSRRLMRELTTFQDFLWSPNSQYIAVTGHRANASGDEYTLTIYDTLDDAYGPDRIFRRPGRFFGEFVLSMDANSRPIYAPIWSIDSRIISVNFRDGIHFYDITDCTIDECRLLYILEIGYVPWFDWYENIVVTLSDNTIQLWDVSELSL